MFHDEVNVFGETNFRNKRVQFGIKTDDRRRHMYVIGKTGMGKSHLLRHLAYNDIQAGRGLAFVDPHGDSADWLLDYIPAGRINDVVFINPTDIDFPIAFNVLEKVDRRYHNLVADGLVGVFKKIWAESWGPRLEYLMRNAILALLDYQDSTLLGVTRMLVDKSYRKKVIARIHDPVVKAFWVGEFSKYNDKFLVEAISPIQNKVGQFLANAVIRNIVGQPQSTINLREIMDQGKILILNLSKGKIGEESSALLGAMIITKLQLAAMSRADIAEEARRDFFLYVDEFQTFATESFADILSEARKYRLSLIMAHQYIEQMPEAVASAVFGNVGTLVSFRVGAADAEVLEKEFAPVFMQNDLVNLPKYGFYIKLMIDGVASDGFSANTVNMKFASAGNKDKVIKVSRERYANPREKVEEKIARWSGVFEGKESEEKDSYEQAEEARASQSRFKPIPAKRPAGFAPKNYQPKNAPVRPTMNRQVPSVFQSASKYHSARSSAQFSSGSRPVSVATPMSNASPKSRPISSSPTTKFPTSPKTRVIPPARRFPTPPPPIPPRVRAVSEKAPPISTGISLKEAVKQEPQSVHQPKKLGGQSNRSLVTPNQKVKL